MITDSDIKVEVAEPEDLRNAAMVVREQVFVKELKIPKEAEFDGKDRGATHILAYMQKQQRIIPIGTMRIRFLDGCARFERMAVIRDFRKTDISEAIMQCGFDYAVQKGYRKVQAACKKELLSRWQRCGFYVDESRENFELNGMKLIPIRCDLPPHPRALTMNSDFHPLIAKKGHLYDEVQEVQKPTGIEMAIIKIKKLRKKCRKRLSAKGGHQHDKAPNIQKTSKQPSKTNAFLMNLKKLKQKCLND